MESKQIKWDVLPDEKTVQKTAAALKKNGIEAYYFKNRDEAIKKFHELVPDGAEVMNMSSTTLTTLGLDKEITESGKYDSVKKRFAAMDPKTQGGEMRKLGAAPSFAAGSVHAVTLKGEILVASATGSQLPAYAYGAGKVVWLVGTQKIVKDLDSAFARLCEYTFPLEDERARKAYGSPSSISKVLIINKEPQAQRLHLIFIQGKLGF